MMPVCSGGVYPGVVKKIVDIGGTDVQIQAGGGVVTATVGAVVNVGLNFLLIPRFSAMGAAIATFASYFIVMIIRSVNTKKYVPFNMGLPKLIFNTLAAVGQAIVMVLEIKYWVAVEIIVFSVVVAVNGRDIFCRGSNWIPAECMTGIISQEKYRALIESARQANMNMLRVWGGGIYESDDFYSYCDQMGIMVWQDFM